VIDSRAVRVLESRVRPQGKSVEIELTLAEGGSASCGASPSSGLKVEWLHRVAYAPCAGKLGGGQMAQLTRQEIAAIERLKT